MFILNFFQAAGTRSKGKITNPNLNIKLKNIPILENSKLILKALLGMMQIPNWSQNQPWCKTRYPEETGYDFGI